MRLEARKYLFHGYAEVDDRLVRDLMESHLPLLQVDVASLMGSARR